MKKQNNENTKISINRIKTWKKNNKQVNIMEKKKDHQTKTQNQHM